MELGFSGEGFANLLTIWGLIGVVLIFIVTIVSRKRGIDISSKKFHFRVIAGFAIIFIVFPLLLSDLDVLWKLIAIVASISAGVIDYFVVQKMGVSLRNRFKED